MCLAEKNLDWESRHVDIFAFENYEPEYTRLNPKAVVPTLDHDGHILIESNIILEYIEDLFPDQVPLRPADPFERSIMRLWVYNSEELAHWNVNVCSHNLRHAKRMDQRYTHEQQIAAAEKCPNPMIALRLKRRLAVGVSVEEENEAYEKLDYLLDPMLNQTSHGVVAGISYRMRPLWTLAFDVTEERRDYGTIDRRDEDRRYDLSFTDQLARHWSVRADLIRNERKSTEPDQGFRENIAFLTLIFKR